MAAEDISMCAAALRERVQQSMRNVILTDNLSE
jgi:hypothetical protein